jgi:hypothetical protein
MADAIVSTPYDSARMLFGASIPTWLNAMDASRLASYKAYEDIYWTRPDTFKLVMRGTNEHPIYMPSGRIICNTMNRYVMRGFKWVLDPDRDKDDTLMQAFNYLFKRENFLRQFMSNRLYGIIRGDAAWMITANVNKPEGTRVKVRAIDPATVFPIDDEQDWSRTIGVDIVEQILDGDKIYVKRQRYMKSDHPDHPQYDDGITMDGEIAYQVDSFELDNWETDPKPYANGERLPATVVAGIRRIPVYTWKNFEEPENPWGSSEMRGIESLFAGINQAASDQDLALAIAGLGNYWTDAGAPVDDDGNPTSWGLGPAEVVEVAPGKTFSRIKGVDSVTPSLNHIEMLEDRAYRVSGASDVAQGRVDVQMAESGIALKLRLGPILDEAGNKDNLIVSVMDQMFYDLRMWLDVYEGTDFDPEDDTIEDTSATIISAIGDKLPEDKEARRKALYEGLQMSPPLFSRAYVRTELRRMGWEVPVDATLDSEIEADLSSVQAADPFGGRLDTEAGVQ